MVEYKERLEMAMKRANVGVTQLATAIEMSYQGVKKVVDGKSSAFSAENNSKAAAALGVSSDWLATGKGLMESKPSGGVVAATALAPTPQPEEPTVMVPLLANSGSMGTGIELQHDDVLVGHIALSEQWVARRLQPTNPAALRFIHAYGDSMHPTFEDGDVLLVDTGMRDPKAIDGVYVMAANDRVYIKRVRQRMDGVVEISSDNPTVKTVDVLNGDHSVDVLGRVVWCWNGRKL